MASVQHGHSQGDLHDDESLLDDDLIEADHGQFFLQFLSTCRLHLLFIANLLLAL